MKLDPKAPDYPVLSTGKRVYANLGVIGLSPGGIVFGGYDGYIFYPEDPALTPAECVELADHMIAEWQKFRATYYA